MHKHTHKGIPLVEIELRYPYGTNEINGIKLANDDFNDVINWNEFTTEVCVGDGHKDSCDDTSGKVLVIDYKIIYIVTAFYEFTTKSIVCFTQNNSSPFIVSSNNFVKPSQSHRSDNFCHYYGRHYCSLFPKK